MVDMLAVVLDSNAIHTDPWLTSEPGVKLLELAQRGFCTVVYPQVVIDELRRQRKEAAERAYDQAANGVNDMAKAGVDVVQTASDLRASFEKIDANLGDAFAALFVKDNVTVAPIPDVTVAEILRRDLERRRPFIQIEVRQKAVSVGFRDALIWETVVELLGPASGYQRVLFVTADKGFLSEKSELHEDLLRDLDDREIDRFSVESIKNVWNAATSVEAAALADLITAATNALYGLLNQEISQQMIYGGEYDYPDFVRFEVPAMESGQISDIEQSTEFVISDGEGPGNVIATCEATIFLDGVAFKGDWFADGGETMTLSAALNDHYFEVSSEILVRVVVELDTSGDSPQVSSVVLENTQNR